MEFCDTTGETLGDDMAILKAKEDLPKYLQEHMDALRKSTKCRLLYKKDTVALKYIHSRVYVMRGTYKGRYGEVSAFGEVDATVALEGENVRGDNPKQNLPRVVLMAYVLLLIFPPPLSSRNSFFFSPDCVNLGTGYYEATHQRAMTMQTGNLFPLQPVATPPARSP